MTAVSSFSSPAVFIASVLIHTPGIILLLQYLFMRHEYLQSYQPVKRKFPLVTEQLPTRELPRRSLSDASITSDDFTRKRRRPYTTYGGGTEYINYLRRRSFDGNMDLAISSYLRGDQTASGRRIPVRSPTITSQTRVGGSLEILRSNSVERRSISRRDSPGSAPPSRSGSTQERVSERPQLRRTRSGSIFKENIDEVIFEKEESRPGSSDRPTSKGKITPRELTVQAQGPSTALRPVLLPPLKDPVRVTRVTPVVIPDLEDLSRQLTTPPRSNSTSPKPRSILKSPIMDSIENRPSSSQSGFQFPFDPPPMTRSQPVEYEEDYTNWKPKTPPSTSNLLNMPGPYTWPIGPEDLVEPEPPFAAEDRQYMSSTPSESRLSTITEEGTIRESMVQTPTNAALAEVLASMRDSSDEDRSSQFFSPMSGLESRESETPRATSRLSIPPIPENSVESESEVTGHSNV
jgi:hypothetical protein